MIFLGNPKNGLGMQDKHIQSVLNFSLLGTPGYIEKDTKKLLPENANYTLLTYTRYIRNTLPANAVASELH
jgi:hypothetical protein